MCPFPIHYGTFKPLHFIVFKTTESLGKLISDLTLVSRMHLIALTPIWRSSLTRHHTELLHPFLPFPSPSQPSKILSPSIDTSHFLSHEIKEGQIYLVQAALAFSLAKTIEVHALYYSLKYRRAKHK